MMIKIFKSSFIPFISVIIASLIGAVILHFSGADPVEAYLALYEGAFSDLPSLGRTLEKATPLIFNGLAIAFALKAGLFNIGAQGQFLFGAMAAAVTGFGITGIPVYLHIPLTLLSGIVAGGLYCGFQGLLKAYTGAHEVITGIMFNYVAINFTDYLTKGPFMDLTKQNSIPRTSLIQETSRIPYLNELPSGFFIALIICFLIWWLLTKTTIGFEIKTTGLNPHASKYAGMKVKFVFILTMFISGTLAGIGGAIETAGVVHRFQPGFNIGLGFEGITIALLGRASPIGVIPAAVLFGAMKSGASMMQFTADVPTEIIDVIQALILFFVAADIIIKKFTPFYSGADDKISLNVGWGD